MRIKKSKAPIIKIDNSLERYKVLPIFQDKVDKANKILKEVGIPNEKLKR